MWSLTGDQKVVAPKLRCSNLELYRIIVMLFIVAHHYVVNSGLTAADGPIYADLLSWRSAFLLVFGAFGKTGINCFVLISGYFMCKSEITAKKFCKLLFEVEFYTMVIWFVFLLTGYEQFSLMGFVKALLPITNIGTGFSSCYLVFFLFIPFLNILIRNMSEKQHIKLLFLFTFMYILIGTIPKFGVTMNYVSWFVVLYGIGSYIRLYDKKLFSNTSFWGGCTAITLLVSIASVVVMAWIGSVMNKPELIYFFLADSNKILAVAVAVSSFMFFKNIKMKNHRFINMVAASCFGVLMIHANSDTMRRWLWQDTLNNAGMYHSRWLIVHAFGSVIVIYTVCTVIDHLRIRFIEKPFFLFWDKHWYKVAHTYKKCESKVCAVFKVQT